MALKGPFKKYVTSLGGGESSKIVTKCDKGGRGSSQRLMSPLQKISFQNRIRMPLKIVITPLHLLFNIAVHVENKV